MLTLERDDVLFLISSVTETENTAEDFAAQKDKIKGLFKFRGRIFEKSFSISKKTGYYQPFVPSIEGKIDRTQNGSIVQLKFKLFANTNFMLFLSTLFIFSYACVQLYQDNISTSGLLFGACLLNYAVAYSNFNIHVRDALKELNNALSWD